MAESEGPMRLWGGRFAGGPAEALARLSVSVQFDWRLAPYDLLASRAHARVLAGAGLLDPDELGQILAALDDLDSACATGQFRPTILSPLNSATTARGSPAGRMRELETPAPGRAPGGGFWPSKDMRSRAGSK